MKSVLIKNCRVISPECDPDSLNSVLVSDGKIAEIGDVRSDCGEVIDGGGLYLIPGLIDMNCKICEEGYESRDNLRIVSGSALSGGFTSLTTAPNTQPIVDSMTVVDYVIQRAEAESRVNIYPYGSITKNCNGRDIAEIGKMVSKGIIAVSDNGGHIESANLMRDVLMYSKMFDIPVIAAGLEESLSKGRVVNEGIVSTRLGLFGSPREAEEIIVSRNLILGKYTKAKLHLQNITTAFSVYLVESGKTHEGTQITAGTSPHYFALTEDDIEGYNTYAKVNPPLRTHKDVEAIKKGLYSGVIDVIASGHTPATIDRKNVEFDLAAYGISSLETAFGISYTELCGDSFKLSDLVEKMSTNPAKILGLKNKGEIRTGYDGDLVLVDIDNEYTIRGEDFCSKAKYTPFEGRKVRGRIIKTFVNGELAFSLE